MMLPSRVAIAVSLHHVFEPGERVVVAVSGGPDSLALLSILREILPALPLHLTVAHFDHGWRKDSQDDRDFVASMAAQWGYAFHAARAADGTPHTESAARTARYAFLRRIAAETNSTAIAMGHTQDDQVETLLLHLLRGSGSRGLGAMRRLVPDAGFVEVEALRRGDPPASTATDSAPTTRLAVTTCACDPTTFKARDQVGHLDGDLVQPPLVVATRRPGDRMRPLGLKMVKRLQDILVDAHVPRHVRDSLPVVSDREEIVWIPGVTVAESKRVTSATRRQLHLEIESR